MPIIANEVGLIAAEAVSTILRGAGDGVDAQLGATAQVTGHLDRGGWTALTAAGADTGMDVRGIAEVARVCGRHLVPQALTTTLLAGHWFELDEARLAGGVTFPVPGAEVVPYAVDGVRVVTPDGRDVTTPDLTGRDVFSELLPVAGTGGATDVAAWPDARRADLAAVAVATATGCADTAIAWSVDWVQTRQQFRQPLKNFQALRHHLANMHIAREEAWTCAVAATAEPEKALGWAREGMERARAAIELGIQVHGGIGFTWEAGIHHLLKHVLVLETLVGGVDR